MLTKKKTLSVADILCKIFTEEELQNNQSKHWYLSLQTELVLLNGLDQINLVLLCPVEQIFKNTQK